MRGFFWSGKKTERVGSNRTGRARAAEAFLFFNGFDTSLFEVFKMFMHFLELLGGMAFPILDLADDTERTSGTI